MFRGRKYTEQSIVRRILLIIMKKRIISIAEKGIQKTGVHRKRKFKDSYGAKHNFTTSYIRIYR